MGWFTNRGQIIQTALGVVGLFGLFFTIMNFLRQGWSFDSVFDMFMSLSVFFLIVIVLAVYAVRATSHERALEQESKRISHWKTLCDVQAQIPGIPKEHIELLTKRLREEMLKS